MSKKFHLESIRVSYEPGFLWFLGKQHVFRISTVELPIVPNSSYPRYETCIFMGRMTDVIGHYDTEDEAIKGHLDVMRQYNIKNLRMND